MGEHGQWRLRERAAVTASGQLLHFPDGSVFVREVGSGTPVLMINGLGAHTAMWEPLERALPGFRLVEFDLPGAGQSPVPRRPLPIRRLASLCAAVMDRHGMQRPHVLGYSMGGMVAQQFAASYPDRVDRLVLVATSPGVGSVQADLRALLNIVTPLRYASARLYSGSIGSLVGGRARHDREWITQQTALRFSHRPTWKGYSGQLRSMTGWSALPVLRDVQARTLVLSGSDDPLAPVTNGAIISYLLPHSRLGVLEGEGHLLVLDEQSGSHAAIRDFLSADDPEQSAPWAEGRRVDERQLRQELALVRRQVPPLSWLDARARRRWLGRVAGQRADGSGPQPGMART
jgi:pimeloyl-ACP methyl ester carboxylesterase